MFERFTDKARTVVILAKAKATERGDQIRPVYLLHALASGAGVAARVLAGLGVDADSVEGLFDRTAPYAVRSRARRPVAMPRRWPRWALTWT